MELLCTTLLATFTDMVIRLSGGEYEIINSIHYCNNS